MNRTDPPGWNPLLGIPPTNTLEKLNLLALSLDEPTKLVRHVGERNKRWPFFHTGDRLVHALLGLHRTYFWQVSTTAFAPVEAITECGVLALLRSTQRAGVAPIYDSGEISPDRHVTCLRCVGGDEEGVRYRHSQKKAAFGRSYSVQHVNNLFGSNKPNMQQMPRTITGHRPRRTS